MNDQYKQYVLTKANQFNMRLSPIPHQRSGEVLIRVRAVGFCGSDWHRYKGKMPICRYPLIIGHEFAGDVIGIGPHVDKVLTGNKVVVNPYIPCGVCYPCQIGRSNCCENIKVFGAHIDGAMQEYIVVPAANVFVIPEALSYVEGTLVEPLAVALHILERADLDINDRVLVVGAGTIGILIARLLFQRGFSFRVNYKYAVQKQVMLALGLPEAAMVSALNELHGEPPTVVIDAVGKESSFRQAIDHVSHAGKVVFIGFPPQDVATSLLTAVTKELTVITSRLNLHKFPEAIECLRKKDIDISRLVTHQYELSAIDEVMRELDGRMEQLVKIVFTLDNEQ